MNLRLAVLYLVVLLCISAAPASAVTFTAADQAAECGTDGVVVTISVDDAAGLSALELDLAFDSSRIVATSVRETSLTAGWDLAVNFDTPGLVRIAGATETPISSGSGPVLEVLFSVPSIATSGTSVLDLGNAMANESAAGSVDAIFVVECGVAGDANNNGSIEVGDIFYLINHLFAGGPAPLGDGDANGNGVIDVGDVFFLVNHLFAGGPAPAFTSVPSYLTSEEWVR
ncbi:MAG: hypothetical protein KY432_00870 [Acidobacteria bacterium]|nr:hypothetical protein [Acidobacteriota bacterium]